MKFPASWRRDIYKTRPSHEQASWLARIESEPDFEVRQLVGLIIGRTRLRGIPYRELVRDLVSEAVRRVRFRLSLPRFGFAYFRRIDHVRRFKGL